MKHKLIIFLVPIILCSCKDIEYKASGVGDALIVVKVTESDTLFGLGLHAYSYDDFSLVYASHESNADVKYNLKPVEGFMNDLSYETSANDFSDELPLPGEYLFHAGFPGGQSADFSDELTDDYILPPKITVCEFNNSRDRIDVSWETGGSADVYSIKLYDTDGELMFISGPQSEETISYSIGLSSDTWLDNKAPETGQEYIVEISSYLYEPNGGDLNLQSTGRIKKQVTWE